MLELEEFQDFPSLSPIIEKINKFLAKDKLAKIHKLVAELEELLADKSLVVPITYILSIFAEKSVEFISKQLIIKL